MLNALKRRFGGGYHKMVKQHQLLAARRDWPTGLEHYFSQALPSPEALVYQMDMVAFDFETSGVNASQDQILSIGWVGMTMDHIDVAASEELFVRHPEFVTADSAVINHITPDVLSRGVTLDDAMDQLFSQLAGKIALVHGACIERAFVAQYARALRCRAFSLRVDRHAAHRKADDLRRKKRRAPAFSSMMYASATPCHNTPRTLPRLMPLPRPNSLPRK